MRCQIREIKNKGVFIFHCHPLLDGYKIFNRLEQILEELQIRFFSQPDNSSTYKGILYAYISPKNPILPGANYWREPWNVEIYPTADPLSIEVNGNFHPSKERLSLDFNEHTIEISRNRSHLDRQFWDINSKQYWIDVPRLFS